MRVTFVHFQVNPTGTTAVSTAGRNAVVTALMVCCAFIVCFGPLQITGVIGISGYQVDFTSWYYHFNFALMSANSFINPFIYAAKYREFQQGVRSLLSKMNLNQQQPQGSAVT